MCCWQVLWLSLMILCRDVHRLTAPCLEVVAAAVAAAVGAVLPACLCFKRVINLMLLLLPLLPLLLLLLLLPLLISAVRDSSVSASEQLLLIVTVSRVPAVTLHVMMMCLLLLLLSDC
jgi:hypothetical protein